MRNLIAIFLVGILILLSIPQWAGAQWVQAANPGGGWITAIVVSGTNLFASTRKGGVFLSTDNGTSWRAVNSGLPKETDFQCLAVSGTNLFAGSVEHGIFLSTDNGTSWTAVNSGLPEKSSVWRLAVSGTNLFAAVGPDGSATVYLSTDNGVSWKPANSGLGDTNVMCLAVIGTDLFVGTGVPFSNKAGGVFLSTDNGTSWKAVSSGLPEKNPILRFAVSVTNLFAGTWAAGRVFLSTDNGMSWTAVNSGLPDPLVFSLSDLAVSGTDLFLGSFMGVFLSANNGASWTAINSGLPTEGNSVYSLAVSETDLFAGTEEGKVWRLSLSDEYFVFAKWHNLGVSYIQAGRLDDAIAAYEKAVKLKSEFAGA